MIVVVGIDQGGAARRDAVTARRSERFSRSGAFDGADTPSSVARAPSRGHDKRLAAG
jgi:hypothetical protein